MILVDTGIWELFLSGKKQKVAIRMAQLLRQQDVCAHEFIAGELLLGDGGQGKQVLTERYGYLPLCPAAPHELVKSFVLEHKLVAKELSWIDVHLLVAAKTSGHEIWTESSALKAAAAELGIAFDSDKD
jgi:hypothetical protein